MLLGTYQPYPSRPAIPQEYLNKYKVFADALGGERPVFCFAANNLAEFCFGAWASTPYWPDRLLLVDTEDCVAYDAFEWNQLVKFGKQDSVTPAILENVDPLFAEYVISESTLENGLVAEVNVAAELMHNTEIEDALARSSNEDGIDYKHLIYSVAAKSYSELLKQLDSAGERTLVTAAKAQYSHLLPKLLYLEAFGISSSLSNAEVLALPVDIKSNIFQEAQALRHDIDVNAVLVSKEDYQRMVRLFGEQYIENCKCFWDTMYQAFHAVRPTTSRLGRNDPCPCESGKKYKKCCGGPLTINIKGMQIRR